MMAASCKGDTGALVGDVGMRLLRSKLPPVPFMWHHVIRYLFNLISYSFTRQMSKLMLCIASAFTSQLLVSLCQSQWRSKHCLGYANGTWPPPPVRLSNELLSTGVNNKQDGITKGSQSIAGKCLLGRARLLWVLTFWHQQNGSALVSVIQQKRAITREQTTPREINCPVASHDIRKAAS